MILVKTEKKSNSLVCRQQLVFGQNSFREPQQTFPQSLKSMHRLIINHSSVIVFWHKTPRLNELEKIFFPNILAPTERRRLQLNRVMPLLWSWIPLMCEHALHSLHQWTKTFALILITSFCRRKSPTELILQDREFFIGRDSNSNSFSFQHILMSVNEFKHWLLYWFGEVSIKEPEYSHSSRS